MQEKLMTLKTTQAEAEDSVSFCIRLDNDTGNLIVIIGIRSEKFGVKETKTFEILLEVFSEAIASYRSDSDNFLDYWDSNSKEIQKFFTATAQLPNN